MSIPSTPKETTTIYTTGVSLLSQDKVTISRKDGKTWKLLSLNSDEKQAIEGAIRTLKNQDLGVKIHDGTELEITRHGLYQRENGRVEPLAIKSPEVQKTMDYVAEYLAAKYPDAGEPHPPEIKVTVTFGKTIYKAERFEQHRTYHKELAATLAKIDEVNDHLDRSEFKTIQTKLESVVRESQGLLSEMDKINKELGKGDLNQALKKHEELAKMFVSFSQAATDYHTAHTQLTEKAQNQPSRQAALANFKIDLGHLAKMREAAEGFLTFVDPEGKETAQARKQLQETVAKRPALQTETTSGKNNQLESLEDAFSKQIQKEVAALEDSRTSKQQGKRLTEKQYADHKKALEELQKCSEQVRRMLTSNRSADLRKELQAYLPTYQKALENAVKFSPNLDVGHVKSLLSLAVR